MANHNCKGDFFTANGAKLYRCFWDGAILDAPYNGAECPNCQRPVDGYETECQVRTVRQVSVGGASWQDLPVREKPEHDA
jgi:hypothetical protein